MCSKKYQANSHSRNVLIMYMSFYISCSLLSYWSPDLHLSIYWNTVQQIWHSLYSSSSFAILDEISEEVHQIRSDLVWKPGPEDSFRQSF